MRKKGAHIWFVFHHTFYDFAECKWGDLELFYNVGKGHFGHFIGKQHNFEAAGEERSMKDLVVEECGETESK